MIPQRQAQKNAELVYVMESVILNKAISHDVDAEVMTDFWRIWTITC